MNAPEFNQEASAGKAWFEHRKQCEERVIGGIMADPVKVPELAPLLSESDFTDVFLGSWFRLACELSDSGEFAHERLRGELRQLGFLESVDELMQFSDLSDCIISSDLMYHAHELRRMSALQTLRRLLAAQAAAAEYLDADPVAIASHIESHLAGVCSSKGDLWEYAYDVAKRVYESHRAAVEDNDRSRLGLSTGYFDIDEITGGFFPGQLWQVAARSYMGKSTVALAFAQAQADRGRGVYIASYEMINDELMERLFADRSATPLQKFTRGTIERSDLPNIASSVDGFRDWALLLDQHPPTSVSALKARVKLAATRRSLSLVIVDHLGLFPHDRRVPRHQQLVEVTRDFKAMAKDLGMTILVLNQLNADADGEEPTDQHYSESKGILANLDVSILLHRESKTSPEMKCKITKNRKGAPGECKLAFDGVIQRVGNWVEGGGWEP